MVVSGGLLDLPATALGEGAEELIEQLKIENAELEARIINTQKDIEIMYNNSLETFLDVPDEDKEILQQFAFICTLSLDVYVKKLLIEKLIDELLESHDEKKKK